MNVFFAEPPPAQAEGGIDLAMSMISTYLETQNIPLQRNMAYGDLDQVDPETDIVHFHGLWQPHHARMSFQCRRRGIPYVVSPHGMLEPWAWAHKKWKKRPYFYLVERAHLNGATFVFATSDLEAENLQPFTPDTRVRTIPLALPDDVPPQYESARSELGWAADETVLVYLSRVHEKKGMHVLLQALAKQPTPERTRLVVVGDGPDAYLRRLHEIEASLADSLPPIDWVGPVWGEKKWLYLQGADLFCLPTHSENFGLVVLEAAQVGTPVLTTTSTPWGFLEDWGCGIIVDPERAAIQDGLAQFFDQMKWGPEQRDDFARRTRQRFDLDTVGAQYVDAYRSAIQNRSVRA